MFFCLDILVRGDYLIFNLLYWISYLECIVLFIEIFLCDDECFFLIKFLGFISKYFFYYYQEGNFGLYMLDLGLFFRFIIDIYFDDY